MNSQAKSNKTVSKIPVKAPTAKKAPAPLRQTAVAAAEVVAAATASTPPIPKAAKTYKSEKAEKADKSDKAKKPKLVRDSFTIPKAEYSVLESLKQRAAKAGAPSKKSELLRAGIKALAAMSDGALLAALSAVPAIKTGRPANSAAKN